MDTDTTRYVDESGNFLGYCNACGDEVDLYGDCCEDGEVVEYEDGDYSTNDEDED